jgi:hypothetical protein
MGEYIRRFMDRRRPWRERELGRLRHSDREELRASIVWPRSDAAPVLEFRQWKLEGDEPTPSVHGFQVGAQHIPWLMEKLTEAGMEIAPVDGLNLFEEK